MILINYTSNKLIQILPSKSLKSIEQLFNISLDNGTKKFIIKKEQLDKYNEPVINLKKDTISENTWTLDIKDINQETFDLGVINPHIQEEVLPEPSEILKEIEQLEKDSSKLLNELKKLI